jgi:methionine-gamma-lyase
VSLGGEDSLVQHPASFTHRRVAVEAKPGISIVRMLIGLEASVALWRDLSAALNQVAAR